MAFATQLMNVLTPGPMLGLVDEIPNPDVISAQILTTSVATSIQMGDAVKLVTGTSGAIVVDKQTGPTDALPFGVIPFNNRKNTYSAGDFTEVACGGSYVWMLTSAAVVRGTNVAITASTTTADPTVATNTTTANFIIGVAVDEASGSGQLIRVKVSPAKNP